MQLEITGLSYLKSQNFFFQANDLTVEIMVRCHIANQKLPHWKG